jgi:disulfide bond formation protein DsbB
MAFLLALLGTIGSLYLSIGMNLVACPLCFLQRAFMLGTLGILLIGGLTWARTNLCVLALPTAVAGLAIAGFHVGLVADGTLECPLGVQGIGSAPLQSLVVHIGLVLALLLGCWFAPEGGRFDFLKALPSIALGVLVAFACLKSNPPLPPAPKKPYDPKTEPLVICRRPYDAKTETPPPEPAP